LRAKLTKFSNKWKKHCFISHTLMEEDMNTGTILAFLIGTYASFAIAVMAATPLLA